HVGGGQGGFTVCIQGEINGRPANGLGRFAPHVEPEERTLFPNVVDVGIRIRSVIALAVGGRGVIEDAIDLIARERVSTIATVDIVVQVEIVVRLLHVNPFVCLVLVVGLVVIDM